MFIRLCLDSILDFDVKIVRTIEFPAPLGVFQGIRGPTTEEEDPETFDFDTNEMIITCSSLVLPSQVRSINLDTGASRVVHEPLVIGFNAALYRYLFVEEKS